jgi:hypothetical protein
VSKITNFVNLTYSIIFDHELVRKTRKHAINIDLNKEELRRIVVYDVEKDMQFVITTNTFKLSASTK